MHDKPNPEMLVVAREARGFTQAQLADAVQISQGKVSKYESGALAISDNDLAILSETLGFPKGFFGQTDRVYGFGSTCFYHRKRQKMPIGRLRMLQAQLNIFRFQVARLVRGIEIEAENEFVRLDADDSGSPEEIAQQVRAQWKLPLGPIRNVTSAVENAGAIVYEISFGGPHLDAMSQVVPGCPPVVFVNRDIPADRLRFTLMHEIGHLIMHQIHNDNMEAQADRFAAEFLMPEREIRASLQKLSLPQLSALKSEWLVSMNALLKRAQDLGQITDRYARTLWTRMAKQGWRTKEPVDIPREKPTVFDDIIKIHLEEHGYTIKELATMVNAMPDRFARHLEHRRPPNDGGFRVVG